ncbi:MAG: RAMP superfamily CRISPR-associated protein [Methylococcales bacterium]
MSTTKKWTFSRLKRWEITAVLETRTPLHIGNGETLADLMLNASEKHENTKAFIRGKENKPFIPGSTLKGKLRSFVRSQGINDGLVYRVFGEGSDKQNTGQGGRAEFHDAPLTDEREEAVRRQYQETLVNLPDWDPVRHTYIEASTAVNRHTRTAQDGSLHYTECVPAGTQFKVTVTGDMMDQEAEFVIATLRALGDQKIALGGEDSNSKGFMQQFYELTVNYLDHQGIIA